MRRAWSCDSHEKVAERFCKCLELAADDTFEAESGNQPSKHKINANIWVRNTLVTAELVRTMTRWRPAVLFT
jgi:hypothetical protein